MSGFIGPELVEQIRQASDIVEVITSYIPLKRAGVSFKARCPFHNEKTPSFHVNPQRQTFHCFGCHKGGDVFTFVREYENLSFYEAAERLADRAKIAIEVVQDPKASEKAEAKKILLKIHEELAHRWHTLLLNDAQGLPGRDYLKSRGVTEEAIKRFQLGYAPLSWDDTLRWSRSRKYDPDLIEKAGLIVRKQEGKDFYDRFRGRLMFPIHDPQGRAIGFSGRVVEGDEKGAKYVNSPETLLFRKSEVIYGLDKAKRAILDAKSAIVCEGQLDLIACHMSGVENVVAPQGTALTKRHAQIVKRYADEIVLCFDSDQAGTNAALRSMDDLIESGLNLRVASVPAPHDPDSYIRELGADSFRQLVDKAEGFFDFLLQNLRKAHPSGTDKDRMAIVHEMGKAVTKTGHAVMIDTYAQKTAHLLNVDVDSIRAEFKQSRRSQPEPSAFDDGPPIEDIDIPEEPVEPLPECPVQEYWLMKLVLTEEEEEPLEWLFEHLDLQWIRHPVVREVLIASLDAHAEHKKPDTGTILTQCRRAGADRFITEAVTEARAIPSRDRQYEELVRRLRDKYIDHEILMKKNLLSSEGLSDDDQMEITRVLMDLRRLKTEPLGPIADS
ncbi:MAG: DNA primase [Verrucomicrobia bacterium]|jgi:DNA primase|nr:DNA primase [Verrucomicrobiota bacterium]